MFSPYSSLSWLTLLACNRLVFFFLSNQRLDYILSYSSLDLCLVLCMLPPLMSYSLTLSPTMMSCTVHSPMDSLVQPSCIVVYIVCNLAPRGSPFELSLGLRSNSQVLSSFPSQSPLVWWFVLGLPWVTSLPILWQNCEGRTWAISPCLMLVCCKSIRSYLFASTASSAHPDHSGRREKEDSEATQGKPRTNHHTREL